MWIAFTRHFTGEERQSVYEWEQYVSLRVFLRDDKKAYEASHKTPIEENFDYRFFVKVYSSSDRDSLLTPDEIHEIKIDSAKIEFGEIVKSFLANNAYEDNKRKYEHGNISFKNAWIATEISLGEVYIPKGTEKVRVAVYGETKNKKDGIQQFSRIFDLHYEEKKERVFQIMD